MYLFFYSFCIGIYFTPSWNPSSCSLEGIWSALWSTFSSGVQLMLDYFRITEPLRLEKSSEVIECPIWQNLHHIESFLDQGWWLHHIPLVWQSKPMFNSLFHEEISWCPAWTWHGYTQPSKAFELNAISFLVHFSLFFWKRFLVVDLVSWKSPWTRSSVQWYAACTTACLWSGSCLNL